MSASGGGGFPPDGVAGTAQEGSPFFAGGWWPLLHFNGKGSEYFLLLLKTFIFSLFTLGIYSFWGRTEQRRYLWSRTTLLGEPLEYTGTGKELFISFLIVMPAFLVIALMGGMLSGVLGPLGPPAFFLLFIYLWQFASYRTLRFRLTRTRWRGIRGNMTGSAFVYAAKATGYLLLIAASLGLLFPWSSARLAELKLDNVWFGNRKLSFSGRARELYKPFAAAALSVFVLLAVFLALTTPALLNEYSEITEEYSVPYNEDGQAPWSDEHYPAGGAYDLPYGAAPHLPAHAALGALALLFGFFVVTCFYRAAFFRWLFRHAVFDRLETRSTLSGRQLLFVTFSNGLILVFTLGLGTAWCVTRMAKTRINSVEYKGDPQLASLLQDTRKAPKTGEGLLEALDMDIAF